MGAKNSITGHVRSEYRPLRLGYSIEPGLSATRRAVVYQSSLYEIIKSKGERSWRLSIRNGGCFSFLFFFFSFFFFFFEGLQEEERHLEIHPYISWLDVCLFYDTFWFRIRDKNRIFRISNPGFSILDEGWLAITFISKVKTYIFPSFLFLIVRL